MDENDPQLVILRWIACLPEKMEFGDIVAAISSFKKWYNNGVRSLDVGLYYAVISRFEISGIIINEDSLSVIYENKNINVEDFIVLVNRMIICQLNNASCSLAAKSCKKTSK